MQCPSCGADLSRRRAIVTGFCQPWTAVAGLGWILIVAAAIAFTPFGIGAAVGWSRDRAVRALVRQAASDHPPTSATALKELVVGGHIPNLSPAQLQPLVDLGLRAQGQFDQPWSGEWVGLIVEAKRRGQVPDAKWRLYARQSVEGSLAVQVRGRIRSAGDGLAYSLTNTGARTSGVPFYAYVSTPELVVDGRELAEMGSDQTFMPLARVNTPSTAEVVPAEAIAGLAPGVHAGHLRVRVGVTDWPPTRLPSGQLEPGRMLAEFDRTFLIQFTVLPPGESASPAVVDETLRAGVEAALTVHGVQCDASSLRAIVFCPAAPAIDLHFDVSLQQGGREWPMGSVSFSPTQWATQRLAALARPLAPGEPGPTAGLADLVFRPSAAAAATGVSVASYWGDTVVKRDVPIARPAFRPGRSATTAPATTEASDRGGR